MIRTSLAFLMLFLCNISKSDVVVNEKTDAQGHPLVTLENNFVKITINPQRGGRIQSIISKDSQIDMANGSASKCNGCLLDVMPSSNYPGNYIEAKYKYEILNSDPQKAKIKLIGHIQAFSTFFIEKTISLEKGSPAIRIDYSLLNKMGVHAEGGPIVSDFRIQNFIPPGNWDFMACGLRGIFCAQKYRFEENNVFTELSDLKRGWTVAFDNLKGSGLLSAIDYRYLDKIMYWPNKKYCTYEWFLNSMKIDLDKSISFDMTLMPFHGLKKISGAGRDCVGELQSAGESLKLTLYPGLSGRSIIEAKKVTGDGTKTVFTEKIDLLAGKVQSFNLPVNYKDGVSFHVRLKGKVNGDFFFPSSTSAHVKPLKKKILFSEKSLEHLQCQSALPAKAVPQTPHWTWTKSLQKGKVKALYFTSDKYQREAFELAQRFGGIECKVMPLPPNGGLARGAGIDKAAALFRKDFKSADIIILNNVEAKRFPPNILQEIKDYVKKGGGLLLVNPRQAGVLNSILPVDANAPEIDNERKNIVKGNWHLNGKHYITSLFPIEKMPPTDAKEYQLQSGMPLILMRGLQGKVNEYYSFAKKIADNAPVMSCIQYGKGRVLSIAWSTFRLSPLVPNLNYSEMLQGRCALEFYYSLLGKAIIWTAQRQSDVALEIISGTKKTYAFKESPLIKASFSGKGGEYELSWELIHPYLGIIKRGNVASKEKEIAFRLPEMTLGGLHFIKLVLKDSNGRVCDWGGDWLTVKEDCSLSLKTEKEFYMENEIPKLELMTDLKQPLETDAEVQCELWDTGERRLIFAENRKLKLNSGKNKTMFSLDTSVRLSSVSICKIKLSSPSFAEAIAKCKIYWPVNHKKRSQYKYHVSAFGRPRPYLAKSFYKIATQMGITGFAAAYAQQIQLDLIAENNMSIEYENMAYPRHRSWTKDVPLPKLAGSRFFERMQESIKKQLDWLRKVSPAVYNINEESGLGWRDSVQQLYPKDKSYVAGYRKFLSNKYTNLSNLNAQWETQYKTWEDITPPALASDMPKNSNPGPWIDWRKYLSHLWMKVKFDFINQVYETESKEAFIGTSSDGSPSVTSGFDYNALSVDKKMNYYYEQFTGDNMEDCFILSRSFFHGWLAGYIGYRDSKTTYFYEPWFLAFNNHCVGYFSLLATTYGAGWTQLHPSYALNKRSLWLKECLEPLKNGIGKAIFLSKRDDSGIRVFFSMDSLYRTYFDTEANGVPAYELFKSAGKNFYQTVEELKRQFRYVSSAQMIKNGLSDVKILYLPCSVCLSSGEIEILQDFVKKGGMLISDLPPGLYDSDGKRAVHRGLIKLLGAEIAGGIDYRQTTVFSSEGTPFSSEPLRVSGRGKCPLKLAGGTSWGKHSDGSPAIIINKYGNGLSLCLNFAPQKTNAFSKLLKGVLEKRQIAQLLKVSADHCLEKDSSDKEDSECRAYKFQRGRVKYFGVLRSLRASNENDKFTIRFPEKGHLYDSLQKKYLGFSNETSAELPPGGHLFYSLLPYKVEAVELQTDPIAKAGKNHNVKASLKISAEKPGDHVLRMEVFDPKGTLSLWHCYNLLSKNGTCEFKIPFALNDKKGEWTIRCIEIASGCSAEAKINLSE